MPDVTSTDVEAMPPTSTLAPARKFVPLMLSSVPTVPVDGLTLEMVGAGPIGPMPSSPPQAARNVARAATRSASERVFMIPTPQSNSW